MTNTVNHVHPLWKDVQIKDGVFKINNFAPDTKVMASRNI